MSETPNPRMKAFVDILLAEAENQNLIAKSTWDDVWHRHILDSLQLLPLAPRSGHWIDVGSGAGLPGIPLAIASSGHSFTLVEPRRRRAEFLTAAVEILDLHGRVQVVASRVEACCQSADIISARAVAPLNQLFEICGSIRQDHTVWLLPKGRSATQEIAEAQAGWNSDIQLVPSQTQIGSSVIVATNVTRRRH